MINLSSRGVSNLEKWESSSEIYISATPIAVKGSLIYNYYIKKLKLEEKYEKIQQGDKIKFIYLKEENPISGMKGDKVISFPASIPKELDIHRFVDYNMQFTKSFLDPLETILNVVGGTVHMKVDIEYKDLMFLKEYLSTQLDDISTRVKESYTDEETSLDAISSLGRTRDSIHRIVYVLKQQL